MGDQQDVISSLPDRPLAVSTVDQLERHERIQAAVPLNTYTENDRRVTDQFILHMESAGYLLELLPVRGWIIVEKDDEKGKSAKERVTDLRNHVYHGREAKRDAPVPPLLPFLGVTYERADTDSDWWPEYLDPDGSGWE